jgi:lipopolysaccharide heptosyltransferase II
MSKEISPFAPEPPERNLDEYGYPLRPDSRGQVRKNTVQVSKFFLLSGIYLGVSFMGGLIQAREKSRPRPDLTSPAFQPERILVIRLDLIGDLVMTTTLIRALKRSYPAAQIDLMATPGSASILGNDPDLSQVIPYDPNIWRRPKTLTRLKNWRDLLNLRKRLHARQYDLAISVFGPWAALLAVISGASRRLGFAKEGYPGLMTDTVPGAHWSKNDHKHEVDYCLELAQAAGATIQPEDRTPHIYTDPNARKEVKHLLEAEGIQFERPLVTCQINSNNGQSKRWPIPYWATLLDRLIREGVQVVLTGAPADQPNIQDVMRRMQERPLNLAARTSLPQLAALLQLSDLLISGDSGPMHVAAAVGAPVLAIFGPTDPAHSGPISPKAIVLRNDIWCSPCYNAKSTADCRFFTTQCMKNITPTSVYEMVQQILQQPATTDKTQIVVIPTTTTP